MDVVNEINETNEMIVEWNQVEISNKPNNDSIKLFNEIMMLGELSMDD
nr:13335_t:CDS:2 [Entrophospora candida]